MGLQAAAISTWWSGRVVLGERMHTDWAPVIVALAAAIPVLAAAVASWIQSRSNGQKIDQVHDVAVGRQDVTVARVEQLEKALNDAGVAVPPHASGQVKS